MSRLAVLVAAALFLPAAGNKPGMVTAPANAPPVVTASWAPRLRMPHLPRFHRSRAGAPEVAQMNTRLRALVVQEEAWYAVNGTYGRDAGKVATAQHDTSSTTGRVQVEILYAGKQGWTAIASHPDAPGKSCVVFVGVRDRFPIVPRTRADGNSAVMEGIPACDAK
jgi:hypothetical protein